MTSKQKNNLSESERTERIRAIIKREFHKELQYKENEVRRIDENLRETKLLSKRVRYAVVSSYYSKANLKVSDHEIKNFENLEKARNPKTSLLYGKLEETKNILSQQPVHPSIKKLIGKRPVNYDEILSVRKPREAAKSAIHLISEKLAKKRSNKQQNTTVCHDPSMIPISSSITVTQMEQPKKVPRYITPIKIEKQHPSLNSSRGKNQIKNIIIIGNTSKYIGNDHMEEGELSHKWLVFIKTREGFPIEEIVEKARFQLHPSYRPNDVVEVCSPPYQLTRRGWGEFPLKIQLFFKDFVHQKPVQVIHKLTLDKTHSGKQTLSAETIVELWLNAEIAYYLKEPVKKEKKEAPTATCVQPPIKLESMDYEEDENANVPTQEISNGQLIKLEDPGNFEKEKSVEPDSTFLCSKPDNTKNESNVDLLKALQNDHEYCAKTTSSTSLPNHCPLNLLSKSRNNLLKNFEIEFFKSQFKSVQKAVEYLLNKLPLIDDRVKFSDFHKAFPFISENIDAWNNMHFVKQRYKEWSRSKFINNLLKKSRKFQISELWTTKEILIFARRFGYSSVSEPKPTESEMNIERSSVRTASVNSNIVEWLKCHESLKNTKIEGKNEIIDIEGNAETDVIAKDSEIDDLNQIKLDDTDYGIEHEFVNSTCRMIGIYLKPEEILEGVSQNASSAALVTALKCFIEDLLKRAISLQDNKVYSKNSNVLSKEDIKKALLTRPEFDILTNAGLGDG